MELFFYQVMTALLSVIAQKFALYFTSTLIKYDIHVFIRVNSTFIDLQLYGAFQILRDAITDDVFGELIMSTVSRGVFDITKLVSISKMVGGIS